MEIDGGLIVLRQASLRESSPDTQLRICRGSGGCEAQYCEKPEEINGSKPEMTTASEGTVNEAHMRKSRPIYNLMEGTYFCLQSSLAAKKRID